MKSEESKEWCDSIGESVPPKQPFPVADLFLVVWRPDVFPDDLQSPAGVWQP